MSGLALHALKCPQCGAPGVVREGTRITECDRCGTRLILTRPAEPRYEAEGRLTPARAASCARSWLDRQGRSGTIGRPELVLVPFHEITGRRAGVYERKIPERNRLQRVRHSSSAGPDVVVEWQYSEKADTRVLLADVQHLAAAAVTPWDLTAFNAREARRTAELHPFDLADAQRRATVFTEDMSASALADRRFAEAGGSHLVALSRRTLFFPFWSVPIEVGDGSYEIVLDGLNGEVVAWRLPERSRRRRWAWLALAVPGALALGQAVRGWTTSAAAIDPVHAIVVGVVCTGAALWWSARPDWRLRRWPEPGSLSSI